MSSINHSVNYAFDIFLVLTKRIRMPVFNVTLVSFLRSLPFEAFIWKAFEEKEVENSIGPTWLYWAYDFQ